MDLLSYTAVGAYTRHNEDVLDVLSAEALLANAVHDADTLITISFGSGLDKKNQFTCQGFTFPERQTLPYRSSTLRASGFEKVARLLDDARYQRRMRKEFAQRNETVPDAIRYLLDLGPSKEENARIEHLEALTLPKGIIRWSLMTYNLTGLSPSVAAGHDDVCACKTARSRPGDNKPGDKSEEKADKKVDVKESSGKSNEDDGTSTSTEATPDVSGNVNITIPNDNNDNNNSNYSNNSNNSNYSNSNNNNNKKNNNSNNNNNNSGSNSNNNNNNNNNTTTNNTATNNTTTNNTITNNNNISKNLNPKLRDQSLRSIPLKPDHYNLPDYCEVRHAANVVRLLLVMENVRSSLVLDSAARVYTIAGLAKIFEIDVSVSAFSSLLVSGLSSHRNLPQNADTE